MNSVGYFFLGVLLGLFPAMMGTGAADVEHFPLKIFLAILAGSGLLCCFLGKVGVLGSLLRFFGKDVHL